ncbi:MAG: hypothetical protein LBT74_01705 [Acidobacteriota bacterium]|jgi:enamine deaminase RidA (YjgF/YER057c/UK114 family)|nr:hypothetical protein [Acidobacteriota bacterium]
MERTEARFDGTELAAASFTAGGVTETHLFAKGGEGDFARQLGGVVGALDAYLRENGVARGAVAFARYFVSDYANQAGALRDIVECGATCALSIVQQPPLGGGKVAAWFYVIDDRTGVPSTAEAVPGSAPGGGLRLKRGAYEHLWCTRLTSGDGAADSFQQTARIFADYGDRLERHGCTLKDNLVRTWLFVKDIDSDYQGLVDARREFFHGHGMTERTHYVSSTGIGGRASDPRVNVLMDAYAVKGVSPRQIRFLQAPERLNPTHEYGVTFERGTGVDYGDRRHVFISGTASIDRAGGILHENDVRRQTDRALENVEALLADGGATVGDVAQMIVYLRDGADAQAVAERLCGGWRAVPKVVVLAPVCRPGWLVEVECIAVAPASNPGFASF